MEGAMEPNTAKDDSLPVLADDILRGADEIAEFIFGPRGSRRKVYYLAECTKLPIFRLGSRWIEGQEERVIQPPQPALLALKKD
jgi:hypothetical protein